MSTSRLSGPVPVPTNATGRARRYRVGIYSFGVLLYLASSALITPMFPLFQARWHYAPVITTVMFAAYTVLLLSAILCTGPLSDRVGRKRVLLVGTGWQLLSLVILAWAPNLGAMIGARAIEGFATGVCLGPLGAGLIEDHRGRPGAGALVNNVLTSLGTALGAVACAWLLTTTGQRTGIPYAIAVGLTVVFLVVVWTTRDSNPRRPFHRELLVPRVSASKEARRRMVQSMPVAVAAASASGFTLTLGPSLVRLLTGSASPIHAAEAVTVFMVASGIAMVLIRSVRAERIIVLSAVSLTAGAAAVFLAAQTGGIGWLLVGVLLEGIGFGGAFDGTVRYVVAGADPTQRAGTLSVIFIVIYTSISVPTVVAGVIAGEVGVLQTTRVCAVFVGVMSLCVLVMHRRRPRLGRPVTDRSAP